jgi:TetR/AcrR family transcriptional regulator, repressor for uid operon
VSDRSVIDRALGDVYKKVNTHSPSGFPMRTADPVLQNRRRSEIVFAAEQCFLQRGFHQTSMQNIAAAANLSMGLLYRYFANKEAIIDAVAQRDHAASLAEIANLPVEGGVIPAWVSLLIDGAALAATSDYAALASEIVAEAHRSPKIHKMLRDNEEAVEMAIINKLTEQHHSGAIRLPHGAKSAAQSLLLLFDGLTTRKLMTPPELSPTIEQGVQHMVQSLFHRDVR